jgi:hypothetical protein
MKTQYKAIAAILAFGLIVLSASAEEAAQSEPVITAQEQVRDGLGVGIIVGEPTGLSAKKWISDTTAIDAAAAWSFADFTSFQIHADYLWHNYDLIKTKKLPGNLAVYYGIGGRLKFKGNNGNGYGNKDEEDARLGVRIPLGISYVFQENSVELFAEVVPILDVVPETELGMSLGVGARYYFSLR